jgi:hypothetical protein
MEYDGTFRPPGNGGSRHAEAGWRTIGGSASDVKFNSARPGYRKAEYIG